MGERVALAQVPRLGLGLELVGVRMEAARDSVVAQGQELGLGLGQAGVRARVRVGVRVALARGLGLELRGLRAGVVSVVVLLRGLGLVAVEVRVGAVGDSVMVLEWGRELVLAGLMRGVAGGVEGLARALVLEWAPVLAQVLVLVRGQAVGWEAGVKAAWHACQPLTLQFPSFCNVRTAAIMGNE